MAIEFSASRVSVGGGSVSPSSSASRAEGVGVPMSLEEFGGLSALVEKVEVLDAAVLMKMLDVVTASYHAYLRKFGVVEPTPTVASATSGSRVSNSSRWSDWVKQGSAKPVSEVPAVLCARVQADEDADGLCYLRAVKPSFKHKAFVALGKYPIMIELLKQPAEWFDMSAGLGLRLVSSNVAHVTREGGDTFKAVLSALVSRVRLKAGPASLYQSLTPWAEGAYAGYTGSTKVGARSVRFDNVSVDEPPPLLSKVVEHPQFEYSRLSVERGEYRLSASAATVVLAAGEQCLEVGGACGARAAQFEVLVGGDDCWVKVVAPTELEVYALGSGQESLLRGMPARADVAAIGKWCLGLCKTLTPVSRAHTDLRERLDGVLSAFAVEQYAALSTPVVGEMD